jgi:hypothetical protein
VSTAFLVAAIVAGAAGAVIGLPAWRSWQARAAADRNTERYLAWRGRADRSAPGIPQQMTPAERWRIAVGVALVVVAVACLVIGLTTA